MSDIDQEQLQAARDAIMEHQKASISFLQSELGVARTVASAIIFALEEEGFVGKVGGSGKREIIGPDGAAPEADSEATEVPVENLPDYAEEVEDEGEDGDTAVDRFAAIADDFDFDLGSVIEDLRDHMLDTIKQRPKPWSQTSQADQRTVVDGCKDVAEKAVLAIADAIAAGGREPVRILLTKVALGNDTVITGKVRSAGNEEDARAVQLLFGSLNKHVVLTAASLEDYSSGDEAETDADEPDFGFESSGNDEDLADEEPEGQDTEAEADAEAE